MQMQQRRCFPSLVVVLGLLFLLGACSQTPSISPVSTPSSVTHATSTSLPTPLPTATPPPLGTVPTNCTPGLALHPVFSSLGPGIGQSPLWVFGFGGPHTILVIETSDPHVAPYGWERKLIWEVGPHFSSKITLSGKNVRTGVPIWFQFDEPPVSSAVLDPQHFNHPAPAGGEGYAEWGSYIFVPVAGCYQIEASWPGGQWSFPFAAGRQ